MIATIINSLFSLCVLHRAFCLPLRKWTLHTSERNWNDANAICNALGGKLATPTSPEDKSVFQTFMGRSLWYNRIGLAAMIGAARSLSVDEIVWTDCSQAVGVWSNTPLFMNDDCGTISLFKTVATKDCDETARAFFCEFTEQDPCPYNHSQSSIPYVSGTTISVNSLTSCQTVCDAQDSCLAFTFDYAQDHCKTYEATDPLYFEWGSHLESGNPNIDTFYKTCYNADVEENNYLVNVSASLDPINFQCGVEQANATVYTIYSHLLTWNDAGQACEDSGKTLAVIDNVDDFNVIRTLSGNTSLDFLWVGYKEDKTNGRTYWTSGEIVLNVTKETPPINDEPTCGAMHLYTGQYKLHDCAVLSPYVCQEVKGRCGYHVSYDMTGVGFTDHGYKSTKDCRDECATSQDCQAFVHSHSYSSNLKDCYTFNMNSWKLTFQESFASSLIPETDRFLARWTCFWVEIIVILQGGSTEESNTTSSLSSESLASSTESSQLVLETTATQLVSESEIVSESVSETDETSSNLVLPSTVPEIVSTAVSTSGVPSESSNLLLPSTTILYSSQTTEIGLMSSTIYFYQEMTSSLYSNVWNSSLASSQSVATPSPDPTNTTSITTTPKPTPKPNGGSENYSSMLCPCECPRNMTIPSEHELRDFKDLIIPAESTSSFRRSKESAPDSRPSSQSIGALACAVVSSVIVLILLADVLTFWGRA